MNILLLEIISRIARGLPARIERRRGRSAIVLIGAQVGCQDAEAENVIGDGRMAARPGAVGCARRQTAGRD
jgi:hypothetical protein